MQIKLEKTTSDRALLIWLLSGCFLVFLMVVVGGITRLTGSGLSITEWEPIVGVIPPLNEKDWNEAFEKYKQIPQYKLINYYFELKDFKFIFFWEWFHRLLGRILGVVFIVPFLYFYFKKRINKDLMPKLLLIFALGGLQGFLGWFMVKSGLHELTYVSHFRLAVHLLTAFITCGVIFWTALGIFQKRSKGSGVTRFLRTWNWLFALLLLQIIYGAFVAGLHAGFEINTWPLMNGKLFFTESFTEKSWILNFVNNKAGVQIIHRYLAYLVLILTVWWAIKLKRASPILHNASVTLIVTVCVQFVLGIITILVINQETYKVAIGVVHQCGAFLLFNSYIFTRHKIMLLPQQNFV